MNKLIFIITIGLLFSCQNLQKSEKAKENTDIPNVINDKSSNISKIEKEKEEINTTLKESLSGVWASDEYREKLFNSNSLTAAEKAISFYTDIVFDGKEILHCNKPSFMEEDYLYLKPDSTVTNHEGEFIFKLTKIEGQSMNIKSSNNQIYTFKRVVKKTDLDKIYMEVTKGSDAIKRKWIAGSYKVILDNLEFSANLLKNGDVVSELNLKWISPFSYQENDIIEYRFDNDSTLLYMIKEYSDSLITLEGIEDITELDAPIVQNGKTGYMKKE